MNTALLQAFEQHREQLLGFIHNRLNDPESASDLLQELYIKVRRVNANEEVKYPKAYVYRMVNNLIIDTLRKQKNQASSIQDDSQLEQLADERSPEQILSDSERLNTVKQAIEQLPDKTQKVFQMQRIQALEKVEVADRLGISVNMVEKHLRKALQYCREKLTESEK